MNERTLQLLIQARNAATPGIQAAQRSIQSFVARTKQSALSLKTSLKGAATAIQSYWAAIAVALVGVRKAYEATIGAAIEYESAFAGVRKTVETTEIEFKKLSRSIRDMATTIPVAASDLAGIMEIAGQLGVRGTAELTKFTEVVAKIAVTTNLTKEAAATDFARIANVMKEPLTNIDKMASAVVALGNTTATTESEIVGFATRLTGAGKIAGLTTADLFGMGAAFTAVGVKAEAGGTAVNTMIIDMAVAVQSGGDKLEKFARTAGLTSEEFRAAYKTNAGKAFAIFIEGLGRQGLRGAKVLEDLGLGNKRMIRSFLSVGGATGLMAQKMEEANSEFEKNIALNEEAAKRFKTSASQIKIMKNNFSELGMTL